MKKILILLVVLFGFITGVDASTYTGYKIGDEIEVNLNSTLKTKFIVIKDSDASTREVKAIYKDTIPDVANYQSDYNYSESNAKIESLKNEWTNVTSVSHPNMEELFGDKYTNSSESFHFNDPKWLITDLIWWTSTIGKSKDGEDGHWTIGSTLTKEGTTGVFADSQKHAIRPVINVNKDYVVGGVVEKETPAPEAPEVEKDTLLEKFVEKYKNTEFIKNSKLEINVTHTDNTMLVSVKDGETLRKIKFEYSDGILSYIPSTDDTQLVFEAPFVFNCLDAISSLNGYDVKKVREWFLSNPDLIISKDGVEYEIYEITLKDVNGSITSDAFKKFKLNLQDGLTNYDLPNPTPTPEVVPDNPHTGIAIPIILVITLVGIGAFVYKTKGKDLLKRI